QLAPKRQTHGPERIRSLDVDVPEVNVIPRPTDSSLTDRCVTHRAIPARHTWRHLTVATQFRRRINEFAQLENFQHAIEQFVQSCRRPDRLASSAHAQI